MVKNQIVSIGENDSEIYREPNFWMRKMPSRIHTGIGITLLLRKDSATAIPSTALKREDVGVNKSSA